MDTIHSIDNTQYSQGISRYTVHRTTQYYTLLHSTQYTVHSTPYYTVLHTTQYTLLHSTQYTVHSTPYYTVHSTQYTVHRTTQYTVHSTPYYTVHSTSKCTSVSACNTNYIQCKCNTISSLEWSYSILYTTWLYVISTLSHPLRSVTPSPPPPHTPPVDDAAVL